MSDFYTAYLEALFIQHGASSALAVRGDTTTWRVRYTYKSIEHHANLSLTTTEAATHTVYREIQRQSWTDNATFDMWCQGHNATATQVQDEPVLYHVGWEVDGYTHESFYFPEA